MNRRTFLKTFTGFVPAVFALRCVSEEENSAGFFSINRKQDRWLLADPSGEPFFSLAMNHIDSATLRYPENIDIWRETFGNNKKKWLQNQVRPDLQSWGFNSVGWVQEVVTRGATNHRHSRNFTFEEYQWLDMPYCHMLPFADFHQWEAETKNPDFFSDDFADWCDYVARDHCARFAEDPKLIGYFYIDCPTWVHTIKESRWKGPLFDPGRLDTENGRKALFDLATQYYKVTHDAIRRYDQNHLILGDRYNAQRPWAKEVLLAAKPYVDVMSFQHFGDPDVIKSDLDMFADLTGLPVLLADSGVPNHDTWQQGYFEINTKRYAALTKNIAETDACLGLHFCGAYLRNKVRKYGLRHRDNQTDEGTIREITVHNRLLENKKTQNFE